jgi:hypothetical protein
MNFRLPAILFGVVLVLGLILLGLSWIDSDKPTYKDVLTEELANAGLKAEQVDRVEIERTNPAGKIVLARSGKGGWKIEEPITATADASAAFGVVNALLSAKPTPFGELSANPAIHGLDPPSLRITLRSGETASTVNFGDVTRGGQRAVAFVTTSTRKRPMAVPRSELAALFRDAQSEGKAGDLTKWVSDYRSRTLFPSESGAPPADEVQALKLTAKGKTLALRRVAGKWQFESPANWGDAATDGDPANPTSFTAVGPLLGAVTSLRAQSADDFIEHPKDLKEYGLEDNPDAIQVQAELKDKDKPLVLLIGKKADAPAAKDAKMPLPPSAKVYVRVGGEQGVIRASGSNLDGLPAVIADPTPLRDRTLLATDKNRIDAADVTVGGQTVKLRKRGSGPFGLWELYGGPGDPQKAGEAAVGALLDVLTERRTIKDFPVMNDAHFAGPELKAEVKLWADGIDTTPADPKADPKAEPKLKGNPYTLQFGKKEGESIYVRRTLPSGAKTDFILPENVLVKAAGSLPGVGTPTNLLGAVAKTRLDFLDTELKSFSEFNVNRLTIAKGAQVTEVVREEKPAGTAGPGGWKYAQPEPMKGKDADPSEVSILLTYLASQRAVRFIDEQPTDAKLVEYGLDPKGPVMRVSVGFKAPPTAPGSPPPPDADKDRVYDFGKETTDGGHVYARQQGRAAVFTLSKDVFNRFAGADLRDKTVIRFDQAKVKGLKLRGWHSTGGVVTVLEFERKGSDWVAKVPKEFNLDPTKVNMFIASLNGLKAKAFVAGPQKPEYGFPPEQQGLEVTLAIEGSSGIVVNFSAPTDNGASYFGWTNDPLAGGSLFTVPADLFKMYKEKPAAFAK